MGSVVLRAAARGTGGARALQGEHRGARLASRLDQLLAAAGGTPPDQGALARPARRKKLRSSSYLIGAAEARTRAAKSSRKRRKPASSSSVAASITFAAASRGPGSSPFARVSAKSAGSPLIDSSLRAHN